jgi:hypothetical protein
MKNHRSKLHQFKNLDGFSTTQIKALFGFHPTVLAEILLRRFAGIGAATCRTVSAAVLSASVLIWNETDARVR